MAIYFVSSAGFGNPQPKTKQSPSTAPNFEQQMRTPYHEYDGRGAFKPTDDPRAWEYTENFLTRKLGRKPTIQEHLPLYITFIGTMDKLRFQGRDREEINRRSEQQTAADLELIVY